MKICITGIYTAQCVDSGAAGVLNYLRVSTPIVLTGRRSVAGAATAGMAEKLAARKANKCHFCNGLAVLSRYLYGSMTEGCIVFSADEVPNLPWAFPQLPPRHL